LQLQLFVIQISHKLRLSSLIHWLNAISKRTSSASAAHSYCYFTNYITSFCDLNWLEFVCFASIVITITTTCMTGWVLWSQRNAISNWTM